MRFILYILCFILMEMLSAGGGYHSIVILLLQENGLGKCVITIYI